MNVSVKRVLLLLLVCSSFNIKSYNSGALNHLKKNKKARGIEVDDLDFSYANLTGIHLPDVFLSEADFEGADLSRANFEGANLSKSTGGMNMQGAKFSRAILREFKVLDNKSNSSGADFSGADLTGAILHGDWSNVNFEGAILYGATFENANLTGTNFKNADLSRVNFVSSDIEKADFTNANLTQAKFNAAQRKGNSPVDTTYWKTITLKGADLGGACMQGCLLCMADIKSKGAIQLDKIKQMLVK